ncbi:MAG: hypothetical protein M1829_002575 [Trizodia sp. TS-e1964]|nr:MAG: hypothetical protein M1829_002575 [Trizodia sp. TS-e1964]
MFDSNLVAEIEGIAIDRPTNALLLTKNWHDRFGQFKVYFDQIDEEPNTYVVRVTNPNLILLGLPRTVRFQSESIPLPSPRLLAVHKALARMMHLTGAGEIIDHRFRDYPDDNIAADGTTDLGALITVGLLTAHLRIYLLRALVLPAVEQEMTGSSSAHPSGLPAWRHLLYHHGICQGNDLLELGGLEPWPLPADDPAFIARWDERYRKLAHAINLLLTIPPPDARPGPVGGGIIRHPLFHEYKASRVYDTVEDLEQDINQLAAIGHRRRRYFVPRPCPKAVLERDLHFYLSDFYYGNFIIVDEDSSLCLLDFDYTGFLPLSFLGWSISIGSDKYDMMKALRTHLRTKLPTHNNSAITNVGRLG